MLAELATWLATPCPLWARRMGLLHETIAIGARHQRCREAWQPHLENTRRAILQAADACPSRRTALILGSGWLLDVPLEELAARFRRVILVDAVHPRSSRRQARRHVNVDRVEHDVSECAEDILALTNPRRLAGLGKRLPSRFLDDPAIDFVASVNLLSQLPLAPARWLRRRHAELDETAVEAFGSALMERHLDYLATFQATACLIADAEQNTYDSRGDTVAHKDFRPLLTRCQPFARWNWEVAPLGEAGTGLGCRHRVMAGILVEDATVAPHTATSSPTNHRSSTSYSNPGCSSMR